MIIIISFVLTIAASQHRYGHSSSSAISSGTPSASSSPADDDDGTHMRWDPCQETALPYGLTWWRRCPHSPVQGVEDSTCLMSRAYGSLLPLTKWCAFLHDKRLKKTVITRSRPEFTVCDWIPISRALCCVVLCGRKRFSSKTRKMVTWRAHQAQKRHECLWLQRKSSDTTSARQTSASH